MNEKPRTRNARGEEIKNRGRKPADKIGLRLFLFFVAAMMTSFIIVAERPDAVTNIEFSVGEPSPRTLFSPYHLVYTNEGETRQLREAAAKTVLPVFNLNPKTIKDISSKVDRFFIFLQEAGKKQKDPSLKQNDVAPKLPLEVSDETLKTLLSEPALDEARKHIEVLLERYLSQGVVSEEKKKELLTEKTSQITVRFPEPQVEKQIVPAEILTATDIPLAGERILPEMIQRNRNLKNAILDVVRVVIAPNLDWDETETKDRRKKAMDAVPEVQEQIKKNELILQRGMLVSTQEKERVFQIQKKMRERQVWSQFGAAAIVAMLAYLLLFLYLRFFDRKRFKSFQEIFLLLTVHVLTVGLCKVVYVWPGSSSYLMPVALTPLLLVLLVDARLGWISTLCMTAVIAPLVKFYPPVVLGTLVSGAAVTLSALHLRKRVQFVKVGAALGLSYFAVILSFLLFQETPFLEALQEASFALANGLLITTPLCFLLLPVFEHLFDLATDVTLLELSDLNHPLLRRMIVEAPGTYHHSLVVSTLGEGACEAIGANSLLARVGCYFHDIGKIARAEFFTENQADKNASKHERLAPSMSSLVIMNHVKDGIALGKRYKLKKKILQFIPEHQGTGVVYYFYKKALDSARPGEKINANDYRYPGPKPQSRETAVALLADSTEAASRSLKEPSPESIRQLVRKIINDKFIDGQLDECDLTLRDLHKIQESFVANLMAIFHTRVSYPAVPADPGAPDLFDENSASKIRPISSRPGRSSAS